MLLLTLATAATCLGVWPLVRAVGFEDRLVRAIAFATVVPAQMALLVLVVGGPLRTLRPGVLCLAAVALGAAEFLGTRRPAPSPVPSEPPGHPDAGHPTADPAEDDQLRRPSVRARWAGRPGTLVADLLVAALGVVVGLQYLWQAVRTIILPTHGWDALSYHLISPTIWVQRGTVGRTGVNIYADGYPQGQELLHAWTMTFLHSLRGTGLVVLWFAGLGGLCVAWLARALGASPRWSTLSALLFLGMPAAFLQVSSNYVDLAGAATALATLILLSVRPRAGAEAGPRRWMVLIVLGAALGLAVAIKASNLALVPLVLVLVAADGALFVQGRPRPTRTAFRPGWELALLAAPLLAVGSSWYLRNLAAHGNPFYPVTTLGFTGAGGGNSFMLGNDRPDEVVGAPLGLLGGVIRSWIEDLTIHPNVYDQRLGGLGAVWLLACLPCLALVIWRARASERSILLLVGLPTLAIALASQTAWWARFTLAFAAVGCAAVGPTIERLGSRRPSIRPWRWAGPSSWPSGPRSWPRSPRTSRPGPTAGWAARSRSGDWPRSLTAPTGSAPGTATPAGTRSPMVPPWRSWERAPRCSRRSWWATTSSGD